MFNEKSLLKCFETLKIGKLFGIKYSDCELPSSVDEESGFHISCYRRFNALSQYTRIKIKREAPKKKPVSCMRRSETKSPSPAATSGVFEKLFFFCCQKSKKKNNKRYTLINCVNDGFEKNIKKCAIWREDHRLLAKIQDICFSAKEVCYHSICRVEYENIAKATRLAKEELSLEKTSNGGEMKEQTSLWYQTRKICCTCRSYHRRSYKQERSFICYRFK